MRDAWFRYTWFGGQGVGRVVTAPVCDQGAAQWWSALEQANVWNPHELARDSEQPGDRQTPSMVPTTWIGGKTLVVRPLRTVHGRTPAVGPPLGGLAQVTQVVTEQGR